LVNRRDEGTHGEGVFEFIDIILSSLGLRRIERGVPGEGRPLQLVRTERTWVSPHVGVGDWRGVHGFGYRHGYIDFGITTGEQVVLEDHLRLAIRGRVAPRVARVGAKPHDLPVTSFNEEQLVVDIDAFNAAALVG
jgi:hypothetical protein